MWRLLLGTCCVGDNLDAVSARAETYKGILRHMATRTTNNTEKKEIHNSRFNGEIQLFRTKGCTTNMLSHITLDFNLYT